MGLRPDFNEIKYLIDRSAKIDSMLSYIKDCEWQEINELKSAA